MNSLTWNSIRRATFAVAAALLLCSAVDAQQSAPTARAVIDRIKQHVGVNWSPETVDTFKAGNPDAPVTGIAVTMMATLDVLRRAAATGKNLIITHEPTFFDHLDDPQDLPQHENDAILAAKLKFIADHRLVIWRFHDHWHARTPDGILAGLAQKLAWEKFQDASNPHLFQIPATTLEHLTEELRNKLGTHAMRVIGDPALKVTRVGLVPGASGFGAEAAALDPENVQVLITGEPREWETVEYVADAVSEGRQKSLIILGHIPSEQAGMEECARWLKTFIAEVPIEFVPTRDPFWTQGPLLPARSAH